MLGSEVFNKSQGKRTIIKLSFSINDKSMEDIMSEYSISKLFFFNIFLRIMKFDKKEFFLSLLAISFLYKLTN